MKTYRRTLCALTLACSALSAAHAGMQINGTRVVYPANQREVSLSMINNGTQALLVQAWVDSGDARERPETSKAPFVITPPISRVDVGKGQTLRIMFTGSGLPQDRESLFWLNVLEIPPKPKAGAADGADKGPNYLQLAVRSRMKLFYRPKDLPGSPDAAVDQLHWRLVPQGAAYAVECRNDTAYNVSFSDVAFRQASPRESVSKGGMCPAKGSATFTMSGSPDAAGGKLALTVINDFGGFNEREAVFSR